MKTILTSFLLALLPLVTWAQELAVDSVAGNNITFADTHVKQMCVYFWDTNGDGELSEAEAAAVTTLNNTFTMDSLLTSFDELQYFTGLTSINEAEFGGCSRLTSIALPWNVQSIGKNAFRNCHQLRIVDASSALLTYIGVQAFAGCNSLQHFRRMMTTRTTTNEGIIIPRSVKTIDSHAFYGCSQATNLRFDETSQLEVIGQDAFAYCTSLQAIQLPASVNSIGEGAFMGTTGVVSVTVEAANSTYHSAGNALIETASNTLLYGCVNTEIPDYVTTIADGAFYACDIQAPKLPNGLNSIGQIAFAACRNLTNIEIPASVTSIGYGAFFSSGLNAVTSFIQQPTDIDASVFLSTNDSTNYEAMAYTYRNATLFVPAGTKALYEAREGWKEFLNIVEMVSDDDSEKIQFVDPAAKQICVANWDTNEDSELDVNEAAAVTELGSAFQYSDVVEFDELRYFTGLNAIGNDAFAGSSQLQHVELPATVNYVGERAFYGCTNLTRFDFSQLDSIGYRAFWNCASLSQIEIPARMVGIGAGAFAGCSNVLSMTVEDNNPVYSEPLIPEETPTEVILVHSNVIVERATNTVIAGCWNSQIPDGITAIGDLAFSDINSLHSISLPEGLTTIGEWAFSFCTSLEQVEFPSTLNEMGALAFYGDTNLQTISSAATNPAPMDFNALMAFSDETYTGCTLYVPAGTAVTYRNTLGWNLFQAITEEYVAPTTYPLTIVVNGEVFLEEQFEEGASLIEFIEALTADLVAQHEGEVFSGWNNLVDTMPAEAWVITGEFSEPQHSELADVIDAQGVHYSATIVTVQASETGETRSYDAYTVKTYEPNLQSDIVIPDTIGGGYSVVSIEENAFQGATALRSIVLPENIMTVGIDVFRGASNLLAVTWNSPARVSSDCFDAPAAYGNLLVYVNSNADVRYQGNVIRENQIASLTLIDQRPLYVPENFTAGHIELTHEFTKPTVKGIASGWEAFVLPFDVQSVTHKASGRQIAPFSTSNWTGAYCWQASMYSDGFAMSHELHANQPFIIAMPNNPLYQDFYNVTGEVTFSADNVMLEPTTLFTLQSETNNEGLTLVGSYTDLAAADSIYMLNDQPVSFDGNDFPAGGVFVRGGSDVKPFQAYINDAIFHNARAFIPIFPSDASDIQQIYGVGTAQRTADGVYDLSGRKVADSYEEFMNRRQQMQRGVYVTGNRKFTF